MIARLHPLAGAVALLTITIFFAATAAAEFAGDPAGILAVKTGILWGMLVLVPAMATVGITGFRMGARSPHPRVAAKRRRMPVIALNGLLVLLPSAVLLRQLAASGDFGTTFMVLQSVEFVAGAINIALLALSMRDGLVLKGRIGRRPRAA